MGPLRGYSSTMTVFDEIPEDLLARVRRPRYRDCRGRFTRTPAPMGLRQIIMENSIKDANADAFMTQYLCQPRTVEEAEHGL